MTHDRLSMLSLVCFSTLAGCAGEPVELEGAIIGGGKDIDVVFEELYEDGRVEEIDCMTLSAGTFEETVTVHETPTRIRMTGTVGDLDDGCDGNEFRGVTIVEVDEEGRTEPVVLEMTLACTPPQPGPFDSLSNIGCSLSPGSVSAPETTSWWWGLALPLAICWRRRRVGAARDRKSHPASLRRGPRKRGAQEPV